MPAGIRIDIHLGGFRDSAEASTRSKERLRQITERLAEEVKRVLLEQTNVEADEDEGTLTERELIRPFISEGLGPAWPPKDEPSGPRHIGEGAEEHFAALAAGNLQRTL